MVLSTNIVCFCERTLYRGNDIVPLLKVTSPLLSWVCVLRSDVIIVKLQLYILTFIPQQRMFEDREQSMIRTSEDEKVQHGSLWYSRAHRRAVETVR